MVTVAGVEVETVGVGGCCDQQVCHSAVALAPFADDGGDDQPVAAYRRAVEGEWLELCLDFLEPRLPFRRFAASGNVAARCGPATSSAAVTAEIASWSGSAATTTGLPVDDDRGVEQAGGHSAD